MSGTVDATWHVAGTGDFNGDGRSDIIFRNDNGSFTEWQSNGSGFAANVYGNTGIDNSWSLADIGDFNGDGRDDLLWRHASGAFFDMAVERQWIRSEHTGERFGRSRLGDRYPPI